MKEYKVLPNPVQKNMQAEILNSLHEHCVCLYRKMFGKKSEDETEEVRTKRWSTVNDTLSKMVLGTYIGYNQNFTPIFVWNSI